MKPTSVFAYDSDHMPTEPLGFASGLPVRRHAFASGESVFHAGDRVSRFFYVSEGAVRLLRPLKSGERAVMQVANVGAWLAEASLFSSRYHCDALCIQPSVLVSVSKPELISRLASDGVQALALAQWMATQLRELRQLHEIVRVRGAKDRVTRWLEWKVDGQDGHFTLASTWSEVADELALTREALYRTLADLKCSAKLHVDGPKVTFERRSSSAGSQRGKPKTPALAATRARGSK